jgi:SOS-response transcriptional repressor LexA
MPQGASQRADAAALADDVSVLFHNPDVRSRTYGVNSLEYVRAFCEDTYMADQQTIGARLAELKERAGATLDAIAERAGYARRSSVQEYFRAAYQGPLSRKVATRLADALAGLGTPPIQREEVLAIVGEEIAGNVGALVRYEGASADRMREDLPVYGTALGAERIVDGEAIEQTTLNKGEVLSYSKRPVILNDVQDVYALHVQGSSMEPVHADGSLIVVRKGLPLRRDDDVVLYLRPMDDSDDGETATKVLVKRFLRRTGSFYELRQFQPDKVFQVATNEVLRADRVLTLADLLS